MRLALAFVAMVAATPALALDRCEVRVVKNVGAEDDPSSVLPKGSTQFGPVTSMRVIRKNGRMSYCAHGSFCYSASAFTFLSGCTFTQEPEDDPDAFNYDAQ